MLKRITQNPKTSCLAGIVFGVAIVLVWFEKATLVEAGVFLPAVIGLLFAKDK